MNLREIADSVKEFISAAEDYTAVISAGWQARFCYGVNSPEEVEAGKPFVAALNRFTDAERRLTQCVAVLDERERAFGHAVDLIADIMRDKVNPEDECEKWLRAYAPERLSGPAQG